ncbi:hypothetical protein P5V15_004292 [Pogonomyrmex californicus]
MRIEVEKIKNELRIREEKWRKEKEEMKERIERMEKKFKRVKESAEAVEGKRNIEIEEWKERVRKLERRWETKERGDRRRNILIRGLKEEKEEKKTNGAGERRDMVMKITNEVMKKKILTNKWKLKGGETWIEEDLTWEEKRIKWKIRQAALRKRAKERKVRVREEGMW